MAHWRSISFPIPEAQFLADLAGIETDLLAVERISERFIAERAKEQPDWELLEIACAAALVRYGRAFASGIRAGVPAAIIDDLEPEHQQWHQYLKDARDKWIAHSVNSFEDNEVTAWLMPPERGPLGVTSISVRQHRVTSLAPEAIAALKTISSEIRRRLASVVATENARILAIAQALPPEPFYSQVDPTRLPGKQPPGKARGRK